MLTNSQKRIHKQLVIPTEQKILAHPLPLIWPKGIMSWVLNNFFKELHDTLILNTDIYFSLIGNIWSWSTSNMSERYGGF